MNLNTLEIIVIISLVQGILFTNVILTQKNFKVKANMYLAYGTLVLVFIGFIDILITKDFHKKNYFLNFFLNEITWTSILYIPMFIYFFKSTNHKLAKSKKLILLTIPFWITLILVVIIHLHFKFKLIRWDFIRDNYHFIYEFNFYFSMLFSIVLCTLSFFTIKKSSINYNEKQWLKNIWFFNATLLLVWVIDDFIKEMRFIPNYNYDDNQLPFVWLGISVYVYWLIFKGLIQLKLSQDKSEINLLLKSYIENKEQAVTINTNKLKPDKGNSKNIHFDNFLKLLTEEKLYRNADLSRDMVAEKLNISSNYLSQLINASVDSNFTSLINDYRINDVKHMLLNPTFNKYSIVAIGLEAGFKSKSTFYNEFKKKTGHTPNQFKTHKNKS